ncbi:TPA: hypothetical protein ACWP0W_004752, partial [Escherichia coli]
MIHFIIPLLFLFFSSFSFAEEKENPDALVQCAGHSSCRTDYSDAGTSIKLARAAGHLFCGSGNYDACSGIIHYCGVPLSTPVNAPSTVGSFVRARWSAYKVWDSDKQKWTACTLAFQGGEGDLTPEYNKPVTEENCLSRPVIKDFSYSLGDVVWVDTGNGQESQSLEINGCRYLIDFNECDDDGNCIAQSMRSVGVAAANKNPDGNTGSGSGCDDDNCDNTTGSGGSSGSGGSGSGSGGSSGSGG